ncbi:hypothetical protein [Burkholderia vietnamiensis]|uniref:hypothetical protein n=1 Tax=Burkholderia vietnamiensis TaxID=60552 RepID=UPI001591C1B3|nr:hypothetical protein [Burkholderia vietnamiensis]
MTTPVIFIDDASRCIGSLSRTQAEKVALSLLETIKKLRKLNKKFALNCARPISQHQISDKWTLQSILGGSSFNEEWMFIRMLADRSPFSAGLRDGLLQEVIGLEFRTRPNDVPSTALAWASLLDTAIVSFDINIDWAQAWVEATYQELEDDGNISEADRSIRNASRLEHVDAHAEWLKMLGFVSSPSASQIWKEKSERFPGLRFLPRTEKDLTDLSSSGVPFLQALSALEALSNDAVRWPLENPWPDFSTKATPESEQRRKFCWVHDDLTGKNELFDWHTRFTGGLAGRVHFRVDTANRSIAVAYVGGKLTQSISG